MWSNSSRAQMSTSPSNFQSQGGGSKKAGLPNSIGMNTALDNIYLNNTSQRMSVLRLPLVSTVKLSRPIGSFTQGNAYWNYPH